MNDKYLRLIVVLLCGLFLLPFTAKAADKVLDASRTDIAEVSLTEYFTALEDPSQTLTLADVQKPDLASRFTGGQAPAEALKYGVTRSAYWLRLRLRNASDQPIERMLEISYAVLSNIQFHQPKADGTYQSVTTGAAAPFSTRPYPGRFFVFPLTLAAHAEQVVYLRIQTQSALLVPAKLWMPAAFHAHERSDYALQAWYFGMASAMILFNLLLFIALRDSVYLLYVSFIFFTSLSISAVNGLGKEFIWPHTTQWSNIAVSICYVFMYVALLQLMRRMLNTREVVPRLDRLARAFIGLNLLIPIGIVVSHQTFAFPGRLLLGATSLLTLWIGAYCAVFKHQRIAAIFVLAFSMFVLGPFLIGMKLLKVLPVNFLTTNGILIGSALEMLLMAFALAYRFNLIRHHATQDVKRANASLEQRLQAREDELTATHQRLREIEYRETLSRERQRLMQDMHDGMGSSLASALRAVESGHLDKSEVAQVLKSCIDDLKLAIDSLEPVDADLLLLLATFRFRLGPRLEACGIQLKWEVKEVPALDWLEPNTSLHVLRILQEAFTNIIKHANATEIRLATLVQEDYVVISICDNGCGFTPKNQIANASRGLSNQQRRAKTIGGQISWQSSSKGTCLELHLPLSDPRRLVT